MLALLVLGIILFFLFGGLGFAFGPLFWILAIVLLVLVLGGGSYGRGRGYWNR